ncbi:MAG: hypothetical protein IBX45_04955 [Campylobacterales bacterium]|nr:hypothetical protein [Campylobacterales bacterium]
MGRILSVWVLAIASLWAAPLALPKTFDMLSLMPHTHYMRTQEGNLTPEEVLNQAAWQEAPNTILSFGFDDKSHLWLKATLDNPHKESRTFAVQFFPRINEHIALFQCATTCQPLSLKAPRFYLQPTYEITLAPHTHVTLLAHTHSFGTALKAKWHLFSHESARHAMLLDAVALALFFGAMGALLLYNGFLFVFLKDITYGWYVCYLGAISFHHMMYTGVGYMLFSPGFMELVRDASGLVFTLFTFFMMLFTGAYFKTHLHYPRFHRWLKLRYLLIGGAILGSFFPGLFQLVLVLNAVLVFSLLGFGYYLLVKRNPLAPYFAAGWSVLIVSLLLMAFLNLGTSTLYDTLPYIAEAGIVFEALLFSFALASRLRTLQAAKEESDRTLLALKEEQKALLQTTVEEKTASLKEALEHKEVLLKELNHRVKNNLQMIVSLLNLQLPRAQSAEAISMLEEAVGRVRTISTLHEILSRESPKENLDIATYFSALTAHVQTLYDPEHKVHLSLTCKGVLPIKDLIYCGLILNELLTNAYRHAKSKTPLHFHVNAFASPQKASLVVADSGDLCLDTKEAKGLGLTLVRTLARQQLEGSLTHSTQQGCTWTLSFAPSTPPSSS